MYRLSDCHTVRILRMYIVQINNTTPLSASLSSSHELYIVIYAPELRPIYKNIKNIYNDCPTSNWVQQGCVWSVISMLIWRSSHMNWGWLSIVPPLPYVTSFPELAFLHSVCGRCEVILSLLIRAPQSAENSHSHIKSIRDRTVCWRMFQCQQ